MVHNRSSWAFFFTRFEPPWDLTSVQLENKYCLCYFNQTASSFLEYWLCLNTYGVYFVHFTVLFRRSYCSLLFTKMSMIFNYFHIFIFKLIWRGLNGFIPKKKRSIPTNWGVKVHLLYSIFCCSVCKVSVITISEMSTIQGNVFVRKLCIYINKIRFYETQIPYCETYVL